MSKTPDALRKLARSTKYQNLYVMAKEMSGVQLFDNIKDFTKIQFEFLFWTVTYNRLYQDLAIKDNKYLTKEIIENDCWCECYLIWERKKKPHLQDKEEKGNKKQVNRNSSIPSVIFTRGKKK